MTFVEVVEMVGKPFISLWNLVVSESGDLTMLGNLAFAVLAWLTVARCLLATRPAFAMKVWAVVAAGAAFGLVFAGVGSYFLGRALSAGAS